MSRGNALAVLVAQPAPPAESGSKTTTDKDTPHYTETAILYLRELQEAAPLHRKQLWEDRACTQPGDDLVYRQQSMGKLVMPQALLGIALDKIHLPAHISRDYLETQIQ